jgi:dipeptidyl aminopeptidase/acylaminoacyl peptidase
MPAAADSDKPIIADIGVIVTRFHDLDDYLRIPQVTSLALSPDGSWLAASVQALGPEPKKYLTSIWRIETAGGGATRLTRSADGESGPKFLPDGSLLFASKRPAAESKPAADGQGDKPALWLLPAGGGEARRLVAPPGGVGAVVTARHAQAFLLSAPAFPGTDGSEGDSERRKARADAGVSAILHESGMLRYWDHDLGPDSLRLHAGVVTAEPGPQEDASPGEQQLRDLTPDAGRELDEQGFDFAADGSFAVSGWQVHLPGGDLRADVVTIDTATSRRRTLLSADGHDFEGPAISPDGRLVVAIRSEHDTYDRPGDVTLVLVPAHPGNEEDEEGASGPKDLLAGFDRRPLAVKWAPDGSAVYFIADDNGRRPIFAVRIATGEVVRITSDDAAYDNLCPAADGQALYALRSAISEPPTPVRIDLTTPGSAPVSLTSPAAPVEVPGRVEEVFAEAADGSRVRGWLALPSGTGPDSPAPLLLWVHGGPVMSWNAWSWRWNPWLMVARGYAVLLPDPALSTGYGQAFVARGHGTWGDKPFTDVMAITDVVVERPDIDAAKTAMMGGSFGGYMANWMAGNTSRFAAIVSHAGLWALDQMFGTTDGPFFWRRTWGDPQAQPERYAASSPHLHADNVVTPVLIIHGDRDYRVPIGEALRMYSDLTTRGKQVKFLYFPDENHWILKPGDAKVWYETIFAFLAEHVHGEEWKRPALL